VSQSFVKKVFGELWRAYRAAAGKAWLEFFDSVTDTWSSIFDMGFFTLLFGGLVRNITLAVLRTVDHFQELAQDLRLAPLRALAAVSKLNLPVPKHISSRVMTGEQAVREIFALMIDAGIAVLDGDTPVEVNVFLNLKKAGEAAHLRKNWDKIEALKLVRNVIIVKVVFVLGILLKWAVGMSLLLVAAVFWIRLQAKSALAGLFLPQDSRRARVRTRGTIRKRFNLKSGPDTPPARPNAP